MPTYKNKPRGGSSWLANQVVYGMDVSDPDPTQWKAFGYLADEQQLAAQQEKAKHGAKPVQPAQ